MANLFNKKSNNTKSKTETTGNSIWSTLGTIAVAGLYVAAAVASNDPEYNSAVNTLNTIVPKYDGVRRVVIPASDWDKLEKAEKVFEKNANTREGAVEAAGKIHTILISNYKAGMKPTRTTVTRTVYVERPVDKMSLTEAQTIYNIYYAKHKYTYVLGVQLNDAEKTQLFNAAVVLRDNNASYKANYLESVLANAL